MDIAALAKALIDKHGRKTERLANVLRGTARTHYADGVSDCLRTMQEAALAEEAAAKGEAAPTRILPVISGPLGVQPAHMAQEGEAAE